MTNKSTDGTTRAHLEAQRDGYAWTDETVHHIESLIKAWNCGVNEERAPEAAAGNDIMTCNGAVAGPVPPAIESAEDRLGEVGALFRELRGTHVETAAHSLRVAWLCETWGELLELPDERRRELEIAALLHDVGKIGVSSAILNKPSGLSAGERAVLDAQQQLALETIANLGVSPGVVEVLRGALGGDGADPTATMARAASILAAADALDAMTSDKPYRAAMSLENALMELSRDSTRRFDPQLMATLYRLFEVRAYREKLLVPQNIVAPRPAQWQPRGAADLVLPDWRAATAQSRSFQRLAERLEDGVVFVDRSFCVTFWNTAAEELTGRSRSEVVGRTWTVELMRPVGMTNLWGAGECSAVKKALTEQIETTHRLTGSTDDGRLVAVEWRAVPVKSEKDQVEGVAAIFRDVSSQMELVARCNELHTEAMTDAMTRVANRAQLDRVLGEFLQSHQQDNALCSLVVCDIDHFKRVNDTYNHLVGDEVIKSFAGLLRDESGKDDMVARYGGEEFVLLLAGCKAADATARAEWLRARFGEMRHDMMGGKRVTASFGVAESGPADTPESLLKRADEALLAAKHHGRNRVVCFGAHKPTDAPRRPGEPAAATPEVTDVKREMVTRCTLPVLVEKLRGYVSEYGADVVQSDSDCVVLKVLAEWGPRRRATDRPTRFVLTLQLSEEVHKGPKRFGLRRASTVRTRILVHARPERNRDRRREDVVDQARHVVAQLQQHLMATTVEPDQEAARDKAH